jgi:hypothetical protein
MASIAFHGGPMNVRPASVHFRAKVGFSLSYTRVSDLCDVSINEGVVQSHNPDVCPDSPALLLSVLYGHHPGTQTHRRG